MSLFNKVLAATLVMAATHTASAVEGQLGPMKLSEIQAACQASQDKIAELKRAGQLKITQDSGTLDCVHSIEKAYGEICANSEVLCDKYAMSGLILWVAGVEVNLPVGIPGIKSSRADVRGALGISVITTVEAGSGNLTRRYSIVFQPTISTVFEKQAAGAVAGAAGMESDTFQLLKGGATIIMIPGGKTELRVEDIYVMPGNLASSAILGELPKTQVGLSGEFKKLSQADIAQTGSFGFSAVANVKGLPYLVDVSKLWSDGYFANNATIFLTFLNQTGKIRRENGGVQANMVLELYALNK